MARDGKGFMRSAKVIAMPERGQSTADLPCTPQGCLLCGCTAVILGLRIRTVIKVLEELDIPCAAMHMPLGRSMWVYTTQAGRRCPSATNEVHDHDCTGRHATYLPYTQKHPGSMLADSRHSEGTAGTSSLVMCHAQTHVPACVSSTGASQKYSNIIQAEWPCWGVHHVAI
ncbi:hypothetical protein HaLaN_03109 [Haematococcus lacustris]|uniref:Uncharacterized protein n=1 Tax=Haematococcus lacustris TaxID=44745 RepID=A0A699YDM2_HAELA|nr:hypothetical protein HaLaN_03109 [Haematococcus lacustris]